MSGWTGTLDVELKEHLGAEAFEAIFGPLLHHVAQSARKSGKFLSLQVICKDGLVRALL